MRIYRSLSQSQVAGAILTLAGVAVLVALLAPLQSRVGLLNAGLIFVLFVLGAAAIWGRSIGIFAAIVANLALNFFFIEPLHTLTVGQGQNVLALLIFLSVSIIGGTLVSSARAASESARRREGETQALLRLNRAMVGRTDPHAALRACCHELVATFDAAGAAVLNRKDDGWEVIASDGSSAAAREPDAQERFMAEQAVSSGEATGLGHTGLLSPRRARIVNPPGRTRMAARSSGVAFVPLLVAERTLGVLRVDGPIGDAEMRHQIRHLLPVFAGEAALGLQRVELAAAATHAEALERADQMKSTLLASISHDLKTPIAGIKTAVTSLRDGAVAWSDDDEAMFLETIETEVDRLDRVISDMLDLTRMEAGALRPSLQPITVAELAREAVERARVPLASHPVQVRIDEDLEAVADEVLVTQALANLLENAAKYSPAGAPVTISAARTSARVEIRVEDRGRGIAPRDLPFVFERFYRGVEPGERVKGSGLGLAIVRGFVESCGGSVRAESQEGGGACFVVTLPQPAAAAARA